MRSVIAKLLRRLGLDRSELRAWAMYDWASSAFTTTIVAAVFPIYFQRVAGADLDPAGATTRFALATTLGLILIAVASPLLGTLADYAALKKKMLGAFAALGVAATACMVFIQRGDWLLAAVLFVLGNIGAAGSYVFYDSLLPHIAREEEMDRVSAAGYALGYLGGGLLLAVNLACIQMPERFGIPDAGTATRLSFLSVAIWWLLFSFPLFRRVPEPAARTEAGPPRAGHWATIAFGRLRETLRHLRGYKQAFLMMIAFMIYNDGIQTIIRMATIYGAEIGISQGALILALLITQFVGIPFAFLFGALAGKIGAKRAIFLALTVYAGITVLGYFMTTAFHFMLLAILVGTVQGGAQALSRSLFASMIPRHKSAEFFGFFGIFEKFAGIAGPAVFAFSIWATGSTRNAILLIVLFFVAGGILLSFVKVEEGQRAARAAEERGGV
ncbi:MFS transporter [Nitrospiraceae bacterium HYJII51-Mn-bac16s-1-B09]|uniref:MFS transporter n=1 Tax=Candidatus Manganitrophus noduliformans TaxID=2606439 RepID=A0A7X6DTA7_9BACT|nr:MFS transporter [Candidatus Manganitrophus noduliformans]